LTSGSGEAPGLPVVKIFYIVVSGILLKERGFLTVPSSELGLRVQA